METWKDKKELFNGKIFSLWSGIVSLDDGTLVQRDVIQHDGGVAIVPVLNNHVIFIKQFRISIGREILEIPAGRLENNLTPLETARKELLEEIGYTGKLVPSISYFSSVGFTNEQMHIFFAFDLEKKQAEPEFDEKIEMKILSFDEIKEKLTNNDFEDSKTLIGLRELFSYLKF